MGNVFRAENPEVAQSGQQRVSSLHIIEYENKIQRGSLQTSERHGEAPDQGIADPGTVQGTDDTLDDRLKVHPNGRIAPSAHEFQPRLKRPLRGQ